MRIDYQPIQGTYNVEGKKVFEEQGNISESTISFLIEPKTPSLFTNFQKRKFTRSIKKFDKEESSFESFVRESALILQEYELEFNSKGVPYLLVDHKYIWEKWLHHIDILNSKYSGQWLEKEINMMTGTIAEENQLLNTLLNDFIINELYKREIYAITFDNKTNVSNRKWFESALGVPLEFTQECKVLIAQKKDSLTITGLADLSVNKSRLTKLCENRKFNFDDIRSVTQHTLYQSSDLGYIPQRIESKFSIHGKDSILKQVDISINIKEVSNYE